MTTTVNSSRSPSAITLEKRAKLIESFRNGATQRIACGVSRVPQRTFQKWMKRGLEDLTDWAEECDALDESDTADPDWPTPTMYAGFYLDLAEALASRDLSWLKKLEGWDEKGQGWTKYAWLLERTSQGEFALNRDTKPDGLADGDRPKIEDRSASLADFARLLEAVGALAQLGRGADRSEVPAGRALLPAPRNP